MTKRILALVLCVCLTACLLPGCGGGAIDQYDGQDDASAEPASEQEPDAEPTPAPEADADAEEPAGEEAQTDGEEPDGAADEDAEPTAQPTPSPEPGLGSDAYAPDTVVATINGQDVTWREYYYWLKYYVDYADYLAGMGAFSYTDGWDSSDISSERTNADVIRTSAWDNLSQFRAAEIMAEELDVSLGEDGPTKVQQAFETDADSMGDGDGACSDDEADAFEDYLGEQFVDRPLYDRMIQASLLLDAVFQSLYGEAGADLPDEDAVAYGQAQNLMQAKHILLMTIDSETGEALPEEEAAQKKELADQLYAQLSAVADDHEALEELFDQLAEEHNEDSGASFPDGYLFSDGVMVPEFEQATKALEEYGLSEPVKSDYGWHIILRLPIDPEGTILDVGNRTLLRTAAANSAMMERLTETVEKADIQWQDDFEQIDIAEIFGGR